jgi:uncharacterized membrane protein
VNQEDRNDCSAGAFAYVFGWLSAIYVLNNPRRGIRWHALQSIVVFGGLMLSIIAADSIFPLDSGNALVYLLHVLSMSALIFVSLVLWVLLPVLTFRGKPFLVPIFAPLTRKLAGDPLWLQSQQSAGPPAPAAPVFCPKCGVPWAAGAALCPSCGSSAS